MKNAIVMRALKMFLPAILGAVGGVVATVAAPYYAAFCGAI